MKYSTIHKLMQIPVDAVIQVLAVVITLIIALQLVRKNHYDKN